MCINFSTFHCPSHIEMRSSRRVNYSRGKKGERIEEAEESEAAALFSRSFFYASD